MAEWGWQMAEAMTVELVVEAEWLIQGYWSKLRFPLQTKKRGWSDIDVLSYNPRTKHLVLSESKVRGEKDAVFAYTTHSKARYGNILDYDGGNYFSFLDHLPLICEDGVIFDRFDEAVDRLTLQLVSNYVIEECLLAEAKQTVVDRANELTPPLSIDVSLDTTLDVLARVIAQERERKRGRRYGHPVVDIARELNRYLTPRVSYAGRGKARTEAVRKQGLQSLWTAINGHEVAALFD